MNNGLKKIAAAVLALGLVFGCGGCGSSVPEVTKPTVHKDSPAPIDITGGPVSPHLLNLANLTVAPEYPEMPTCPKQEDYPDGSSEYYDDLYNWQQNRDLYLYASPEDAHDLDPFLEASMKQFLSGEDNSVCAPLNIYFALAMLAESAAGNSRQQILTALGHSNIEDLRAQAKQLWRAHYCSDGETVSLMANSIWLDEHYSFQQQTLSALGEHHYASVFTGDLGTEEMDRQLAQWLDAQTGGLLTEYTEDIELDPATVFALASTAYFCAGWEDSFSEGRTEQRVFHAKDSDITTDFMHKSSMHESYYWGEDFSAVKLELTRDHQMWLILPDEGSSPKKLLEQGDYYDLISHPGSWAQKKALTVNLSMPKFDISSKQELIPGLRSMGITDVFSYADADFRSITEEPIYVGKTEHAARVAVDEEGVIAAAYTLMIAYATGAPMEKEKEIDFIVDRPFLFAITGEDHLSLFAGVVAEP